VIIPSVKSQSTVVTVEQDEDKDTDEAELAPSV
jgi:hypothetical protein